MSSKIMIEQIKTDLVILGSELSPSEVHGTLCGVLCGRNDITIHEWLLLALLADSDDAVQAVKDRELLLDAISNSFKPFFIATISALADNNLNFHPLLPDNEDAAVRLQAVSEWAQGFLMGLTLAGIKTFSDYPDEVSEFIEAMTSISSAADYELAGDDSDEKAIIEFTEFMRMGVLFINEEINPMRMPVDIPENMADSFRANNNIH